MGADQTPDPTALDDDQLDNLLDALAERAAERDDLDLPGSGVSRRSVLASLLGLGGAAAGAGVASAIGESESYGAASGVVGTDTEPLNEANVQDLHAQDAQVDNLLEAEQVTVNKDLTLETAPLIGEDASTSRIQSSRDTLSDFGSTRLIQTQSGIGHVFLNSKSGGETAIVSIEGGLEKVNIISDPTGSLSTTEGNDGSLNIYFSSTNSQYEIENKLGSEATISRWFVG